MKARIITAAVIAALFVLFISFQTLTDTTAVYAASDQLADSTDENLIAANNFFAFDIMRELSNEDAGNVFISPFSISTALAMTYGGAEGTTEDDMASALGFDDMTREQVETSYPTLIKSLENADRQVELSIADSIWIKNDFQSNIKKSFTDKLKSSYESELYLKDFSDPKTPGEINGWISKETRGKIDKMIDKISSDARMFLINAVYFKGQWKDKFDAANTKPADFTLDDGTKIKADMMNRGVDAGYYDGDGFAALRLPYGRDKIAMYIFLPDAGTRVDSFIGTLDENKWNSYISNFRYQHVIVRLPKFEIEYGPTELKTALVKLGMGAAFGDSANFAGISDVPLKIDSVLHKAYVKVNEEGTEAAAVTVVGVMEIASGKPPPTIYFTVDRPFFFVIRDDRSGTLLFMGKIMEPVQTN